MRTTNSPFSRLSKLTALLLAATTPAGVCLLAACESPVSSAGAESTGALGMQLSVPDGSGISSVAYTIAGGPTAKSGTIDVSKSNTVSAILGGLAAGSGYTISITGTSDAGDTCAGSAGPFTVTASQTISVSLVVACHAPNGSGNVSVRGTVDACPEITSVGADPSEVTVGNDVAITAVAGPDESDAGRPLVYTWTGVTSSDAKGNATFHCATPGSFPISVAVTNGDAACDNPPDPAATATVTITCDPSSTQPSDASAGTPRIVLFGGVDNVNEYNDTWEWDGANWSLRSPATSPTPARSYVYLAFDSVRSRTVLFGGNNGNGNDPLSDTWEWDGATWLQPQPMPVPPARFDAALAFDAVRGVTVMFGGQIGGQSLLGDTWEWDGTAWTQRTPSVSPPPRWGSGIAFDSDRGTIVLFGGFGGSTTSAAPLGDTWEWDGTTWTERTPAASPAPRYSCAMAFDSARGRTVVFGGTDLNSTGGSSSAMADTWEWDGATWTESSTSGPSGRAYMPMAYDPAHQVTVLFGGQTGPDLGYQKFNETWTWDGASWAQLSPASAPPARIAHGMVLAYE